MFFYHRSVPGLALESYIIGDLESHQCVVIDPVRDVEEYIAITEEHHLEIKHILETHVHADFISGSPELKARLNGKPLIHCSGMGGKEWTPVYTDNIVKDGDEIALGSLIFKAVHTPGHTPEHLTWVLIQEGTVQKLFTGDFLFVGDIGKPDDLGKEKAEELAHALYKSIFFTLESYPDSSEIWPGHGVGVRGNKLIGNAPFSTLGEERVKNKYFKRKAEKEWVAELMKGLSPPPQYFSRIKQGNISGMAVFGGEIPGESSLSLEEVLTEVSKGAVVLDVRSKEEFSSGHISKSVNIPYSPQLSSWAGSVLSEGEKIILILNDNSQLVPIVHQLTRVGFDHIIGFLKGDGIHCLGNNLETLKTISTSELTELLKHGKPPFVLDVRTLGEWRNGHIKGAVHIPVGMVGDQLDILPKDRPIAVVCGSGYRSSIAASILLKNGFKDVSNVMGGMTAWRENNFPLSPD